MKKLFIISILINCICLPLSALYLKNKLRVYKEMNADRRNDQYIKQHPTAHWQSKKDLFDILPIPKQAIVFLGNSLIENINLNEIFRQPVINRGISGDKLDGITKRVDQVLRYKPSKLFILASANDLPGNNTNLDTITHKYNNLIQIIKKASPATKIYIISELPRFDSAQANSLITPLDEKLKEMAVQDSINYIDLSTYLIAKNGELDKKYSYDGLHLNGQGYAIFRDRIKSSL